MNAGIARTCTLHVFALFHQVLIFLLEHEGLPVLRVDPLLVSPLLLRFVFRKLILRLNQALLHLIHQVHNRLDEVPLLEVLLLVSELHKRFQVGFQAPALLRLDPRLYVPEALIQFLGLILIELDLVHLNQTGIGARQQRSHVLESLVTHSGQLADLLNGVLKVEPLLFPQSLLHG